LPKQQGALFLVVGASGAGKDTLIAAARKHLARNTRYVFPQRDITRSQDAGGEPHRAVSEPEFYSLEAHGGYALCWRAHELCYGIPSSINADLAKGKRVVVNVSREVVADAMDQYSDVQVLHVTASPTILQERLEARGREGAEQLAERVMRQPRLPRKARVIEIANDGPLDRAVETFLSALQDAPNAAR
jgi:phosphonate metabolism protein PhnN/1,5-bisphosphokinase (PRPP-forming)